MLLPFGSQGYDGLSLLFFISRSPYSSAQTFIVPLYHKLGRFVYTCEAEAVLRGEVAASNFFDSTFTEYTT